jgi:RND family efflux transporter MFP subunit
MKNILILLTFTVALAACDSGDKTEQLKAELATLKQEIQEKTVKVNELEAQIAQLDPNFSKKQDRSILVKTNKVAQQDFVHKIQVQGQVASRRNITLGAETMGRAIQVNVETGDDVKRGQLLVKFEAESTINSIKEVETALSLATTIFEKQANLWKQEIGTEVQYLEAKNRKESLERQLATLKSQLDKAEIRAPFNGRVNDVMVNLGELVQPGLPVVSLVGNEQMYLKAEVSEKYINDFEVGDEVEVYLPSIKQSFKSKVSAISYVINSANRTFQLDVKMTNQSLELKPNQFARLQLADYTSEKTIVVPSDIIQQDNIGDFVYAVNTKEGKKVADKVRVERGLTYDGNTEVLKGLKAGDEVITEGYRDAVTGISIQVAK